MTEIERERTPKWGLVIPRSFFLQDLGHIYAFQAAQTWIGTLVSRVGSTAML